MSCTKWSKLKKASCPFSVNVSVKKVKSVIQINQTKQARYKAQFRQFKQLLIDDFKPKMWKIVDKTTLDNALDAYVEERFPKLMSTLTDPE